MSPSKKTIRATPREAQKSARKKSAGKKIEPVMQIEAKGPMEPTETTGLDNVHLKILKDYWSHLPPPPDEDEWMSGRI